MAKLILCGKPNVLTLFRNAEKVLGSEAIVTYGEVMLSKLIPLTWKFKTVFENGNDFGVTARAAAGLLIENIVALQKDFERRGSGGITLELGDFIIILPMTGAGADLAWGDRNGLEHWFLEHKVKVIYVGARLPADIRHVFKRVNWKKTAVCKPNPLASAIAANGDKTVTIFDALRLKFCVDGVEDFQRTHFPDRSEVFVRELLPHLDNYHVRQLLCHKLGLEMGVDNASLDIGLLQKVLGFSTYWG